MTEKHLLVVEDDCHLRILFQTLLEMQGYSSDMAENGDEAMAKLTQTYYDAILLDYILPGIPSITILRYIQQRYSSPVVMITGHYDVLVAAEALEAGAYACLHKPFDCSGLQTILTELFGMNHSPRADSVRKDVITFSGSQQTHPGGLS